MKDTLHPKVAVITRTKDRPVFLRRAMQSVLSQTFDDWVHVIVNDGGDSAIVETLAAFHADLYTGRIRIVHHAESQGMQNASNAGIAALDSEYVVIHDDDDSWEPDFLLTTTRYLDAEGRDSKVQGVITQTTQVTEELTVSGVFAQAARNPYCPVSHVGLKDMLERNLFPPIAFLYRRKVHETVGLFNQEFDVLGDHDFNLRFLRQFDIGVITDSHANYHWRHGSEGNTVTCARDVHRTMLNRMQNSYYRELLEDPKTAVGDLSGIETPPPDSPIRIPFRKRMDEPPAPARMPDFPAEYEFEVLSLDVFDTVLRRRCQSPRDIFSLLQDLAYKEMQLRHVPVAIARAEAESMARRMSGKEISLEQIYDAMASICRLSSVEAGRLMALELELEKRLLYAVPEWVRMYDNCRSGGKRVIFVSDMYLPSRFISEILENNGFADPEVFVSCEYGCSKHDGMLQQIIARKAGLKPERILHVGDNFHSDVIRCIQAGWQAFHWSAAFVPKPWVDQVDPCHFERDDLLSTRIFGEVRRLAKGQPLDEQLLMERLGEEIAGPLYLSFLLWVLERAAEDGIRKLFLLGRDGYYWEKTCHLLAEHGRLPVEVAYLHSSRKVLNFASFRELDDEAIEFLSTPNPGLSVGDFILRAGIDPQSCISRIRQAGFDNPDQVITTPMGGAFLQPEYARQVEGLFKLTRSALEQQFCNDRKGVEALLKEGGFDPSDCAVVDIGWNASCAKCLSRMLGLQKDQPLIGYFFGTWKDAHKGRYPVSLKSFFVDAGNPAENDLLIRESVNLVEALNAAPYPTLVSFKDVDGVPAPQFSENLKGGFSIAQQQLLWKGAERLIQAVLNPLPHNIGSRPGHTYLHLVLERLLREPSQEEIRILGGLQHSEGFGIVSYTSLVQEISEDCYGEDLMRAYWCSNWKRGFLSVLPEEKCRFVLEHCRPRDVSVSELKEDIKWRQIQVDAFWNEKEGYKKDIKALREEIDELKVSLKNLRTDFDWKCGEAHALFNEKELLRKELDQLKQSIREQRES